MTTEDTKMNAAADDLIASLTRCITEEARALKVVIDLEEKLKQARALHAEALEATYAAEGDIKKTATQNALLIDSALISELTAQPN
jgi:hypothetical protein